MITGISISIHALTRSATCYNGYSEQDAKYFNPRTHEECDMSDFDVTLDLLISIHALTRSATVSMSSIWRRVPISIHALTRSATKNRRYGFGCGNYFNPRTHEECDTNDELIKQLEMNFNPRTHEECDRVGTLAGITKMEFQSTHSRGVRPR